MINLNQAAAIKFSILKVGHVISVKGRFVQIQVDKEKNLSHLLYNGKPIKNVSVGSYIKIAKGFERIIGKIEGEYVTEDKSLPSKEYKNENVKIKRILDVSLLGFYHDNMFCRGIKELPLIDNECLLLDENEFYEIHNFVKIDDSPIELGTLAIEKGQPISVGVNCLFASHIGIFGNTGSGKSYTLAKLYNQLFLKYKDSVNFKKNSKFFLIDFNGEYARDAGAEDNIIIESARKTVYRLTTKNNAGDKYPITEKELYDPTIWVILLDATDKTQAPFIRRSLESRYIENRLASNDEIKNFMQEIVQSIATYKDKTLERGLVVSFLHDVMSSCDGFATNFDQAKEYFDSYLKYHNKNSDFYIEKDNVVTYSSEAGFPARIAEGFTNTEIQIGNASPIQKVRLKLILGYYNEIVRGYANKDHISPVIKRLERRIDDLVKVLTVDNTIAPDAPNFTIVSLKDVNIHMRKVLPLLFCKGLYEKQKEENQKDSFLNLIIDEAHNILSSSSNRESEQWKDYRLETFEEIIKEGRKFGVFLTIASQRPFDISPTIISQLHNYFLHRLINNNDIEAIEKTVSYLDKVSFDSLPILPTGSCIMAGLVAQIPVIIEVGRIDDKYRPYNQTIQPTRHW